MVGCVQTFLLQRGEVNCFATQFSEWRVTLSLEHFEDCRSSLKEGGFWGLLQKSGSSWGLWTARAFWEQLGSENCLILERALSTSSSNEEYALPMQFSLESYQVATKVVVPITYTRQNTSSLQTAESGQIIGGQSLSTVVLVKTL